MTVYDSRRKPVRLGLPIGYGGEATVYQVRGQPAVLAKIYTSQSRPEYGNKLAWMLDHPPEDPTWSIGHASLAWPLDLLYDSHNKLAGYLMPHIQDATPLLEVFNPRRRAITLPQFDRRYLYRAARNLAAALGALHASGYVVGDLNESNILVTPSALVTLIDTDSFQVQEKKGRRVVVYRCPVAKLEYTPPELQGQPPGEAFRHPEHDAFGLGVLIFQLLMEGSHPFRARWLGSGDPPPIEERIRQGFFPYMDSPLCDVAPPPNAYPLDILQPRLVDLFWRCFVDGYRNPDLRPEPLEWNQEISAAEKVLVMCGQGHYFSNHLQECPECLRARGIALSPSVISRPAPRMGKPLPTAELIKEMLRQISPNSPPASMRVLSPANPATVAAPPVPTMKPLLSWQEILPGLGSGALVGALSGALSAGVAAAIAWGYGDTIGWGTLWGIGGGVAGCTGGWKLGAKTGKVIRQRVGWNLFWQITGTLAGTVAGGLFGWYLGQALLAVIGGLILGATGGLFLGQGIWMLGERAGWEKVWTYIGTLAGGWLGWFIGAMLGAGWFGTAIGNMTGTLALWLANRSLSLSLILAFHGAAGGAIGGAIAGAAIGVLARLLGVRG